MFSAKTPLTRGQNRDILKVPTENGGDSPALRQEFFKKLEKSLKKHLTKGESGGIIEKLSDAGDGSDGHRSLKIEQQNFEH